MKKWLFKGKTKINEVIEGDQEVSKRLVAVDEDLFLRNTFYILIRQTSYYLNLIEWH